MLHGVNQLKESELEHVPDMLASFKSRKTVVTIPDSDSSSRLTSPPSSDEVEISDESVSSDDRIGTRRRKRKRDDRPTRHGRTRAHQNVRRSTRDTRNRTKYNFSTNLDDVDLLEPDSDASPKKKRGRPSRRAMESSDQSSDEDDFLELSRGSASSRRSRQVTSAHANTNTSERASDAHQPVSQARGLSPRFSNLITLLNLTHIFFIFRHAPDALKNTSPISYRSGLEQIRIAGVKPGPVAFSIVSKP